MESNENTDLKEKIANGISRGIKGLPPFPCLAVSLGEPKMSAELFMEECED